jgi:hypothetical protein
VPSAEARGPIRETVDPEGFTPRPPRPAAERAGELPLPDAALGSAGPADTDVESAAEVSALATPNACGPANDKPTTTAAAPIRTPLLSRDIYNPVLANSRPVTPPIRQLTTANTIDS